MWYNYRYRHHYAAFITRYGIKYETIYFSRRSNYAIGNNDRNVSEGL